MRKRLQVLIVTAALVNSAPAATAQTFPSDVKKAGGFGDILHDQKRIWTFPSDVAHGRHAKLVALFAVTTAGLVVLDPHDTPYFRRTQRFAGFNRTFSGLNTGLGEGLFPGALFLAGLLRDDAYAKQTALLAGEGLIDAEVVSAVMQNVTRRLRPSDISPEGDFGDTWFLAHGGPLITHGSFPSGHATAAFALAAIVAERYRQHRWVPWVAYGLAGTVGFSRITLQSHFPSDVFVSAVLAYAIDHDVVLRRKRHE